MHHRHIRHCVRKRHTGPAIGNVATHVRLNDVHIARLIAEHLAAHPVRGHPAERFYFPGSTFFGWRKACGTTSFLKVARQLHFRSRVFTSDRPAGSAATQSGDSDVGSRGSNRGSNRSNNTDGSTGSSYQATANNWAATGRRSRDSNRGNLGRRQQRATTGAATETAATADQLKAAIYSVL
jgi:hypothetical protein